MSAEALGLAMLFGHADRTLPMCSSDSIDRGFGIADLSA